MNRIVALSILIVCLALGASLEAAAAAPPVEAFGRLPQVDDVALSPGGTLVAWAEHSGAEPCVLVFDLQTGKDKKRFNLEQNKLRGIRWVDDTTLLIEVSITHTVKINRRDTSEFWRILAADVNTGKLRMLLNDDQTRSWVTASTLLATRTGKAGVVIMSSYDYQESKKSFTQDSRIERGREDSGWVSTVFSVDVVSGRSSVLAIGTQFTDGWVVDAEGLPVARGEWFPEPREYKVLAKDGLAWRQIHEQRGQEQLSLVGLSADGKDVLAVGAMGQKNTKLWAIPVDGSGARVLMEDPAGGDIADWYRDPLDQSLLAVYTGALSLEMKWLDQAAESRHKAIARSFPDWQTLIIGRSQDAKKVVAKVESPSRPTMFYFVDFAAKRADIVGEAYPALADAELGDVREIQYAARDGAPIPAYLTVPAKSAGKNLPLVALPHGGPESRDYPEFDWWAQFLASRGYAVLQPQFRGSTGFGETHRLAGRREWGGVMQNDVTDGVKAMIEQGIADPKRICIVGASYGGYAALAGAAFTPDLYACAVSVNGVTDLPMMMSFTEREKGKDSDAALYWRDHIGVWSDPNTAKKSPAQAAASFRAPVLLLHGIDDTRVPLAQSEKMERELRALGKPVTLVKLPGEDHFLSRSETRTRMLTELEKFLAANLAGAPGGSAAPAAADATPR